MAIGNNSSKKKKIIQRTKPDPYLRKEWFNVKTPVVFKHNDIGQTPVLKTSGLRVASECIKGRKYECNLGDLAENEAVNGNIKFYFKAVESKENNSQTDFDGYSVTVHKYQSLFRKGCSKIDSIVDVATKDGYQLRVFGIAFTDREEKQRKLNCYAKTSIMKKIRRTMANTITNEIKNANIKDLLVKLGNQTIDSQMASHANKCGATLRDVIVQRIKVIQAPKFDSEKFQTSLYNGVSLEFGKKVEEK